MEFPANQSCWVQGAHKIYSQEPQKDPPAYHMQLAARELEFLKTQPPDRQLAQYMMQPHAESATLRRSFVTIRVVTRLVDRCCGSVLAGLRSCAPDLADPADRPVEASHLLEVRNSLRTLPEASACEPPPAAGCRQARTVLNKTRGAREALNCRVAQAGI